MTGPRRKGSLDLGWADETALIVAVPETEPVVGEHRLRYDVAAGWGVPAHVTVLYPFVAPAALTSSVVGRLAELLGSVAAFGCEFIECSWFGEDLLWLAPEPAGPFRDMTDRVWQEFPQCPPYGGVHDDVVPHLTVGESSRGSVADLRAVEAEIMGKLPVTTRVDRVRLIAGRAEQGSWRTVCELPLG